jgi:hypothetical protein
MKVHVWIGKSHIPPNFVVKPRPPFVIPLQLGSLTPILGQQPHQPSDLRVTHAKHSPPDP